MSNKRLKRVRGFPGDVVERLSRNNINTCKDFLSRSELELLKLLGIGIYTIQNLKLLCCSACIPKCISGLDLLNDRKRNQKNFFQTSLCELDRILHGGIPLGTITEIAGPSGCGKTQFCTMLSVRGTMKKSAGGLEGHVLYIDTESAFSAERLIQIAQHRYPNVFNCEEELVGLAQSVLVDNHQTCASLFQRLENLEEDLIRHQIKLVIVDSIASLVRKEYSSSSGNNLVQRTNFLSRQAALLKYIAESFCIPVIVTNQITTRFGQHSSEADQELETDLQEGYVTVALGNTWSHNVNTRLILQYLDGPTRQILIAKSPVAPFTAFNYTIHKEGLVHNGDDVGVYTGTDPGLQQINVRSSTLNIQTPK